NKQMYTFTDLGGRSLTLRPELTAPVVRAVLERGLHRGPLPVKLCYAGPMFRQERPQKGRYRQFSQLGVEAIGSDDPKVDAEVIEIGNRFLASAGTEPRLLLNSIGHLDDSCRSGYLRQLEAFLKDRADDLAAEDRARVATNPLRTFDSKEAQTIETMKEAPIITEHLCDSCRKHFEAVQDLLTHVGVEFTLQPSLVRGLDYYTRTAFEFVSDRLGAQDALGGGGRYDGLAEALGGDPLPGIGFALGLDRILLAGGGAATGRSPVKVFVVAMGEDAGREGFRIATELRRRGIGADLDLAGRSMKGQMKAADRAEAIWAVIIGDEEMVARRATLKHLETGEQQSVPFDEILETVSR
ncbi:MAG TPA: histidine--tRNA ligase, partial [Actinomycetota bacterium]|nr:histidine--tRNA ligase [Actinomycetota bacterium]